MAGLTSALAQTVVVPVIGTPPTLIPVTINSSPGDQYDPHVSGDWAAYSSDLTIRYYNFATNIDAQIPLGSSADDLLPDVSGSKIVFTRIISSYGSGAVMVFDAATPTIDPIEIDAASGTNRMGSAIGGNTVAYIDYGLHPAGELVIHDLVSTTSVRITNDAVSDQNPSVSPDGNVVTWEHCLNSALNCDIWQAVKSGTGWSASVVTNDGNLFIPDANPDTNGGLVVYDSLRPRELPTRLARNGRTFNLKAGCRSKTQGRMAFHHAGNDGRHTRLLVVTKDYA